MKHNVVRSILAILLAAVAVFDIAEGVLVLAGVCAPDANFHGTPFADHTVPMLLLAIVVGGSSLLAAATVFVRRAWSVFLAAAAGLIMIAWEIAELAVVKQSTVFQSIFIGIGLIVIALAEYLWATEFRGQQFEHNAIRIALFVIGGVIGTSALAGGIGLVTGAFSQVLPVDWLVGTPFSDYTIPGLVLMIVVGGSALLAAASAYIHHEWAVLISAVAGVLMAGYEVVEIVSLDGKVGNALPMVLGLQLFYFALGVAAFWLAGFLWTREYRGHYLRFRHAGHA